MGHYRFICNCRSMCFRLLVISKCFRSFLPIIKLLRVISFLHIIFYCKFPFILYAKHKKNWLCFFGIVKPAKVLEPRGLTTAFFLSKLFQWKRIIRPGWHCSGMLLLFSFVDFFFIYVYRFWGLNIGFSLLRRRRCF